MELLTKTTLSLVRKMAGRNDLIEVINKHLEREKIWNQWKATRATVLVANHRVEEHVEMTVDRTARPMSDVQLLSRRNTMSGFVGVVGGRDSVAGGVARGEPGRVGRRGEVMRGAAADGEWREGDGHDASAERVCVTIDSREHAISARDVGRIHTADGSVATQQQRGHAKLGSNATRRVMDVKAARQAQKELGHTDAAGTRRQKVAARVQKHEDGKHQ